MTDDFEAQIKAIDAANAHEGDPMEGEADAADAQGKKPEVDAGDTGEAAESAETDDDTLELTEGDEAVDVDDDDEGGEEDVDEQGKRRRSKPLKQRLAEERWKRGESDRRVAELEARLAKVEGKADTQQQQEEIADPVEPDPDKFEFGKSDPDYIDAMVDYKLALRDTQARKADAERQKTDSAKAEQQKAIDRIGAGVQKAQAAAKEKYEDFDDRIAEAVEARGGDPLPPLLTIGIGLSPVGGDIIYRLATDEATSDRLEKLARGGQATSKALALALGELEGEYLADNDDADLDLTDDHDTARMLGRMRSRLAGRQAEAPKKAVKDIPETQAPEPPEKRARGGAGRGKVPIDTDDTKAFYREYGEGFG